MNFENDINYLDQHFLIDRKVINAFIDAAQFKITDSVVEIGPGKCVLSEIIAKKVASLLMIESDKRLDHFINVLRDKYSNTSVVWENVLETYIPPCNKIVSALPYSITEPFIEKLLRCDFDEGIFIVGNNFATSVAEKSVSKLSLLTNSFFNVEKIMEITPDAFDPTPRVMSALIKVRRLDRKELLNDSKMYIIREIFFRRSSKLKNSLMEALIEYGKTTNDKITKRESKSLIEKFNIDKNTLDKEVEQLSNEEFKILYDSIKVK